MQKLVFYIMISLYLTTMVLAAPVPEGNHPPSDGNAQPWVRYSAGRLSIDATDVPLSKLLIMLAQAADLRLLHSFSLERSVSIEFHDLTLAHGLRRLLQNQSYALDVTATKKGPSNTNSRGRLWILSQGDGNYGTRTNAILPDAVAREHPSADTTWLMSGLSSQDVDERSDAVAQLSDSGDGWALGQLSMALSDSDPRVRESAIAALGDIGGDTAVHLLVDALSDADPRMREDAVDALGEIGGATAVALLRQALSDEISQVRSAAVEMLEELGEP